MLAALPTSLLKGLGPLCPPAPKCEILLPFERQRIVGNLAQWLMVKSSLQERAHLLFLDKDPKTTICLLEGEFLYLLPGLGCPQAFLPSFHLCQKGFKTSVLPLRFQEMPLTSQEAEHSLRGREDAGPAPHSPLRPSPRPRRRATPPRACHAPCSPLRPAFLSSATLLVLRPAPLRGKVAGGAGRPPCSECGPPAGS